MPNIYDPLSPAKVTPTEGINRTNQRFIAKRTIIRRRKRRLQQKKRHGKSAEKDADDGFFQTKKKKMTMNNENSKGMIQQLDVTTVQNNKNVDDKNENDGFDENLLDFSDNGEQAKRKEKTHLSPLNTEKEYSYKSYNTDLSNHQTRRDELPTTPSLPLLQPLEANLKPSAMRRLHHALAMDTRFLDTSSTYVSSSSLSTKRLSKTPKMDENIDVESSKALSMNHSNTNTRTSDKYLIECSSFIDSLIERGLAPTILSSTVPPDEEYEQKRELEQKPQIQRTTSNRTNNNASNGKDTKKTSKQQVLKQSNHHRTSTRQPSKSPLVRIHTMTTASKLQKDYPQQQGRPEVTMSQRRKEEREEEWNDVYLSENIGQESSWKKLSLVKLPPAKTTPRQTQPVGREKMMTSNTKHCTLPKELKAYSSWKLFADFVESIVQEYIMQYKGRDSTNNSNIDKNKSTVRQRDSCSTSTPFSNLPPLDIYIVTNDVSFLSDTNMVSHKRGIGMFWDRFKKTRSSLIKNDSDYDSIQPITFLRSIHIVMACTGTVICSSDRSKNNNDSKVSMKNDDFRSRSNTNDALDIRDENVNAKEKNSSQHDIVKRSLSSSHPSSSPSRQSNIASRPFCSNRVETEVPVIESDKNGKTFHPGSGRSCCSGSDCVDIHHSARQREIHIMECIRSIQTAIEKRGDAEFKANRSLIQFAAHSTNREEQQSILPLVSSTRINVTLSVVENTHIGFKSLVRKWSRDRITSMIMPSSLLPLLSSDPPSSSECHTKTTATTISKHINNRIVLDLPETLDGTQLSISLDLNYKTMPFRLDSIAAYQLSIDLCLLSMSKLEVIQLVPVSMIDASLLYGVVMNVRAGFEYDFEQHHEMGLLVNELFSQLLHRDCALLIRSEGPLTTITSASLAISQPSSTSKNAGDGCSCCDSGNVPGSATTTSGGGGGGGLFHCNGQMFLLMVEKLSSFSTATTGDRKDSTTSGNCRSSSSRFSKNSNLSSIFALPATTSAVLYRYASADHLLQEATTSNAATILGLNDKASAEYDDSSNNCEEEEIDPNPFSDVVEISLDCLHLNAVNPLHLETTRPRQKRIVNFSNAGNDNTCINVTMAGDNDDQLSILEKNSTSMKEVDWESDIEVARLHRKEELKHQLSHHHDVYDRYGQGSYLANNIEENDYNLQISRDHRSDRLEHLTFGHLDEKVNESMKKKTNISEMHHRANDTVVGSSGCGIETQHRAKVVTKNHEDNVNEKDEPENVILSLKENRSDSSHISEKIQRIQKQNSDHPISQSNSEVATMMGAEILSLDAIPSTKKTQRPISSNENDERGKQQDNSSDRYSLCSELSSSSLSISSRSKEQNEVAKFCYTPSSTTPDC